jgi:hypothetical protein
MSLMTAAWCWFAAVHLTRRCCALTRCATTVSGISLFAVRGLTFEEMAQQVPLVRFDHLTLIRVANVIGAGLRLEPTGRNPCHYTVGFDELDDGVQRIASCDHQIVPNPYHDA